jgi:hypothetical protein
MGEWIDDLAARLDVQALDAPEVNELLRAAREVAHRVERKTTPLATFLVGAAVARREAGGATRGDALSEVLTTLESLLPAAPDGDAG